jgi:hypothetical protein
MLLILVLIVQLTLCFYVDTYQVGLWSGWRLLNKHMIGPKMEYRMPKHAAKTL